MSKNNQKQDKEGVKKATDKAKKTKKKKKWTITDVDKTQDFHFYPMFEVNTEDKSVETRFVGMEINGKQYKFNYLDLFMFIYFCGNEEIRRSLAMRQEMARAVNYIPYEVTIKLTDKEKKQGMVKRRLQVPIDELSMAIARNEAMKTELWQKAKKGRGKIMKQLNRLN